MDPKGLGQGQRQREGTEKRHTGEKGRRGDRGAQGWEQGMWGGRRGWGHSIHLGGQGSPSSCPTLSVPPAGVKEEPVKEEPVEVKTEPFHSAAADSIHGTERRLPRAALRAPAELCEGWSRSPPPPAPPELSLGELGGQPEPLGSDFPSVLFQQEAEQLHTRGAGEAGTAGPSDAGPAADGGRLSPAEQRLAQSNERLVQELRAFRREYAESRRETASVLRGIAQALGGLSRSLAEIRDLYLREQAVPKP